MSIRLNGATSGSIEIDVPAVAGTDTAITIPATSGGEFIVSDSAGNIDLGPLDINGGAPDDSVNIDGSGRLGIGTTTPAQALTNASAGTAITLTTGQAPQYRLNGTATDTDDADRAIFGLATTSGQFFSGAAAGDAILRTTDGGNLLFGVGSGERARLNAVGGFKASNYGGYTSPAASFHEFARNVAYGYTTLFTNAASTSPLGISIYFSNAAPDDNSAYFIAGTDSSATRFFVYSDGDVWTADAGTLTSDATLKRDITDASPKLADVMKLRVRNFYWTEDYHPNKQDKKLIGFVAQEFEEVFPGLVSEHAINGGDPAIDPDNPDAPEKIYKKGIKEAKLVPILVKALQEAVERIETLEAKVAALEGGTTP